MWIFSSPELKVGILVVTVSALIGVMALKVAEGPSFFSGSKSYYFRADSAGGLVPNSAVKMAGIKVGVIREIILEDGRARIIIALDGNVHLTDGTHVELQTDGILGDKHAELTPGKTDAQELALNSEIPLTKGKGGMDDMMSDISKVAKSLNDLVDAFNRAATDGDDSTRIGRIVRNIEDITSDLRDITGENKDKVAEIVERVRNLTKNIDTYINEDTLARVDRSLKNIEEITAKLNKGEGTLGRLINDEQTVDELNSAIASVNKFLGGADKLETSFDFHTEYLTGIQQTKSMLGLKIQPGLDRYYEVAVVDAPEGVKRSETSITNVNGGANTTSDQTIIYHNKLKLTALFAKNFWDLSIKGGIIEDFGGVGIDYTLLNKNLLLSTELYNFRELQARAFARYNFFKGVYITAGGDNLFSKDDRPASAFVGAGLFITTDDLKLLASKFAF